MRPLNSLIGYAGLTVAVTFTWLGIECLRLIWYGSTLILEPTLTIKAVGTVLATMVIIFGIERYNAVTKMLKGGNKR